MKSPTQAIPQTFIIPFIFNGVVYQGGPKLKLDLDVHHESWADGVQRMVRISVTYLTPDAVTLLLEGQFIGEAVDELELSCERALVNGQRLTLDLAGVSIIDRKGVAFFHRLATSNVSIVNCSGFVAELLKVRGPG